MSGFESIIGGAQSLGGTIGSMGIPSIFGIFENLLFPPTPTQKGPRLNDLLVQVSSYDKIIPPVWGTFKCAGNVIALPKAGINEVKKTIGGAGLFGSGGGGQSQLFYSYQYFATIELAFAEAPLDAVPVLWGDTKIFYDRRAVPLAKISKKYKKLTVTFRDGNEAQLPASVWEAEWGVGNVSAGRGISSVLLEDLQLEDWGNRIPEIWGLLVHTAHLTHIAENITTGFKHIFTGSFVVDVDRLAVYYIGTYQNGGIVTKFDLFDNKVITDTYGQGSIGMSVAIDLDQFGNIYTTFGAGGIGDIVKIDPLTMQIVCHTLLWTAPFASVLAGITLHYDRVNDKNIWMTGRAVGSGQTGHAWLIAHTIIDPAATSSSTPELMFVAFYDPSLFGYPYIDQTGACIDGEGDLWYPGKGSQSLVELNAGGGFREFDTSGLGSVSPRVIFWDQKTERIYFWIDAGTLYKFDPINFTVEDTLDFPGLTIGANMTKGITTGKLWANADSPNNLIEIDLDATPGGGTSGALATSTNETMQVLRGIDAFGGGNQVENNIGLIGNPVYLPLTHSLHANGGQIGGGGVGGVANIYLDRVRPGAALLKTIVADLNRHEGLLIDPLNTAGSVDVDVEELLDEVDGWALSRIVPAAQSLQQLSYAYFFDAVNTDGKMKYVKRGREPTLSIPLDDLAAHPAGDEMPEAVTITMPQPTDLPREIKFNYSRKDFEWESGMQSVFVHLTEAKGEESIEASLAGSDSWARQSAETLLHSRYVNAEVIEIALSIKYLKFDPTDVIEIEVPEFTR